MREDDHRVAFEGHHPPPGGGRLPIVRIAGKLYFQDDRLEEFRRVNDPFDRIPFGDAEDVEVTNE